MVSSVYLILLSGCMLLGGYSVSVRQRGCLERSCPLGKFCPVSTNCATNTSMCVVECPTESNIMVRGNWTSGNCETVRNETTHWTDSTYYEIFVTSDQAVNTPIRRILFISSETFQKNNFTYVNLPDDVTFTLNGPCPYFYFGNMNKTEITFENYYDLYVPDDVESVSLALAEPIPPDDYEMEVIITSSDEMLQQIDIVVHVVTQLPLLPPPRTCVEFESSNYRVLWSAGLANMTLALSGQVISQSFNVTVITTDCASPPAPAIADEDFTPGPYDATFISGATSATASIPIFINNTDDEDKQFCLGLYIDGAAYGLGLQKGSNTRATVTISTLLATIKNSTGSNLVPVTNEGNDIMITCEVISIGDPLPTVLWSKNDGILSDRVSVSENISVPTGSENVSITSVNLTITNPSREDNGVYRCFANNSIGSDSKDVRIAVQFSPNITSDITDLSGGGTDLANFSCQAVGEPVPDISWYLNGVMINVSDNSSKYMIMSRSLSITATENTLTVYDVTSSDVGVYTCTATNILGSDTSNNGCLAGMDYQLSDRQITCDFLRSFSNCTDVKDCVSGCFCTNDYVLEGGMCIHPASCPVTPRIITSFENTTMVDEGMNITITCESIGIPLPVITWSRNEEALSDTVSISDTIMEDDENSNITRVVVDLTIASTSREDTGVYICSASNDIGTDSSNVSIIVQFPAGITENVTDLLENETNPVTFICGATGKPIPTISWYFNNILLNATDHNITSTVDGVTVESSLTIFNAQSSDVGTYTCHADNVFGSDRSSGVLTVNVPPNIETQVGNATEVIREGMNITITCEATGYPPPDMAWSRNNGVLTNRTIITDVVSIPTENGNVTRVSVDLIIASTSREDTGVYICSASNDIGNDSSNVSIIVQFPAGITENVTDLLENETNPVTFICAATGEPIPTISWYFNDILLNATDHNITSTVGRVTVESSLTIFNAQSSDVGTYTCHADNVIGSDRSFGVLTVNDAAEILEPIGNETKYFTEEVNVTLICIGVGHPPPLVQWRKLDGLLSDRVSTTNVSMLTNKGNVTRVTVQLILTRVLREDAGVYECLVSNHLNSIARSINVIVQFIPTITHLVSEEVIVVQQNRINAIVCQAVGEPVPDISWYFNGVMINVSDNSSKYMIMSRSLNITTTDNTLTVYNVMSSDVGVYTCTAANILGSDIKNGCLVDMTYQSCGLQITCSNFSSRENYSDSVCANGCFCSSKKVLEDGMCIHPDTCPTIPNIKTLVESRTIGEGKSIVLTCESTGYPPATVKWNRINGALSDRVSISDNATSLTSDGFISRVSVNLTVANASREDTGEYRCFANNNIGNDSIYVMITVETPPQFIIHPMNRTVEINNESTAVVLTCRANKTSSYRWEIPKGVNQSNVVGIRSESLVLHNVLPSYNGNYQCVAENMYGKNYSKHATLLIAVLPPVVNIEPTDRNVNEGEKTNFTCIASGVSNDSFTYDWSLNDNPVRGEHNQILVIEALKNNSGSYTCSVKNRYGSTTRSKVAVLKILNKFCNAEEETYNDFSITWDRTLAGVSVEKPCTGTGLDGFVRRRCISGDDWEESILCFNKETNNLLNQVMNLSLILNNLNDMEIINTTGSIATMLANLTAKPTFAEDLSLSVSIIASLNDATETVADNLDPNSTFFEETVTALDNLLNVSNEDNWQQLMMTSPNTSQRLVSGIEQFGRILGKTLTNNSTSAVKTRPNIVVKANLVSNESIESGQPYMFSTKDNNPDNSFTGGDIFVMLSNNVLKSVLDQLPPNTMDFSISGSAVRNDALPLPNFNNETMNQLPASSIASVQLPVDNFNTSTNDPIMITFDDVTLPSTSQHNLHNRTCNFYDDTLRGINQNEFGGWSTDGVELDEEESTEFRVVCQAYHLTSFAVLVSIRDEQPPSTPADQALSIISYIGCGISLLCLCISIIILSIVIHRKKKKINNLFIHLNLCIVLALGLIVFVAGIETATKYRGSCIAVAVLLHYFFTSAFCWMLCEGVMLYMMLITVFGNRLNRKWFFMILGWGPAVPIVAISVGIAHEHYGTDHYCWIKSDDGAIFAFIVPIVVIILINCIFIAITLKVLCVDSRKSSDADITDKAKDILKALIVLLPLLGVTWIIGVLAVNEDTVVFAWIFAILNSLQGVFIFIFHVLRNKVIIKELSEHYNFWRSSRAYSFYSRLRSGRYSSNTNTIGISSKHKASQSDTLGYEKKVISESNTTGADEGFTKSYQDAFEAPLDENTFEVKLTTFGKLEESTNENKNTVAETTVNDGDSIGETPPAVLEKQDISPTTNTELTVSSLTEN